MNPFTLVKVGRLYIFPICGLCFGTKKLLRIHINRKNLVMNYSVLIDCPCTKVKKK